MNDLIRLAMERAIELYGGKGEAFPTRNGNKVFNGACFSDALSDLAGITTCIGGRLVRAILTGRSDVRLLPGGSHYELIERGEIQ